MPVSTSTQGQDPRSTQRINVLTPTEWVAWLDQQAEAHHQKRSGLLRDIIRRALNAPEPPPALLTFPARCRYVGLELRSDWLAEIDRRAAALDWKRPAYIRALIWAASQES